MQIVECYDKYIIHVPDDGEDIVTVNGRDYLCCNCTSYLRKIIKIENKE